MKRGGNAVSVRITMDCCQMIGLCLKDDHAGILVVYHSNFHLSALSPFVSLFLESETMQLKFYRTTVGVLLRSAQKSHSDSISSKFILVQVNSCYAESFEFPCALCRALSKDRWYKRQGIK